MKFSGGVLSLAATDLANHVSCPHLTNLNAAHARGNSPGKRSFDPLAEILAERGRAHEAAYVAYLSATHARVESAEHMDSPLELMASGVDVILQPWLRDGTWGGRADFLVKVARPSPKWPWSYEVIDTKLSTNTRAGAVLQLCVYTDLVATLQGDAPNLMHVVKPGPDFPRDSYRFREYAAIYRRLRRDLEERLAKPVGTYPDPCAHCDVCDWNRVCDERRRSDDHLSLVADLGRLHSRELEAHGIANVVQLAAIRPPLPFNPERGSIETFEKLSDQARLQVAARSASVPPYEMLSIEPERGLCRLPAPTPRDVFLDLEGDPFIGDAGREYLFGWYTTDHGYECRWSTTDTDERAAFEHFIDIVMARWDADPGMHVYHYAPYEPTNLKRLACRYATRNDELDRLLRGRRFIDLYSISRQALRAGVESYSIKCLEKVIGFQRKLPLDDAGASMRGVRLALQRGFPTELDVTWQRDVEAYNRDDCEAAAALRDWLELRRDDELARGGTIVRPPLLSGVREDITEVQTLAAQTSSQLLLGVPDGAEARSPAEQGRWLLAHLVDWYRREDKVTWWEYFRLAELSETERLDDQRALAGLEHVTRFPHKRGFVDRYRYPAQEVMMREGEALFVADKVPVGSVFAVDAAARTIDIKKRTDSRDLHPSSVFAHTHVAAKPKDRALVAIGQRIAEQGFAPTAESSLVRDLLLRAPPRNVVQPNQPLRVLGETAEACALRIARQLDGTVLPIQGPPGTGKTETAAKMIVALVGAGRRVGITATSHAVIENLAVRVAEIAHGAGTNVRILLKSEERDDTPATGIEYTTDAAYADQNVSSFDVLGATAWQWARPAMAGTVDVLFIDEAGQLSLADAVAVSGSARSLVLVGDPQQLEQPIQGTHPEGVGVSVLQHMLGGHETIPMDRGLFLEETHRLHESICDFTSEQFYESRLHPAGSVANLAVHGPTFGAPGLYWVPIEHRGCQNRSEVEADAVARLVIRALESTSTWTNAEGITAQIQQQDVLIVAPYNAHVAGIRDALAARGITGVQVGTVDKFQGRQAAIAIYSMATSTPADAPRGLSFLYDRHRLNVATSRARCASVVVCSPALLRPDCQTPKHLHLASALCRFVEMASALGEAT